MDEFQAAVIIAQAACPEATYRFVSANTMRFNFRNQEAVRLFISGIAFYPRLQAVVEGTEVLVTYVD